MTDKEQSKIVWIGGYPFIDGVNAPPGTTSENPVEQQLLDDVQWEAQQKAKGLKGWALFQAFLAKMRGENG
jgi:hypothetical protein